MIDRLRNLAVSTILRVLRVTLRVLSRVVPQSHSVVLSVHPETEGNGLEVARSLMKRYDGRVVWLREAGPAPAEVLELSRRNSSSSPRPASVGSGPTCAPRRCCSPTASTAARDPVARKPIVNIWHGDGPKDVRPGWAG